MSLFIKITLKQKIAEKIPKKKKKLFPFKNIESRFKRCIYNKLFLQVTISITSQN